MKFSKNRTFMLIISLSLFIIFLLIQTPNIQSLSQVNTKSGFSSTRAFEHVKQLAQKIGPRPAGSKGELKAAQYIYYILSQYGWKVREQPFSKVVVRDPSPSELEQRIELINSQNIIAELPGKRADTVIVGAHYDSANVNAPGAVDNASGVGVLLELARVLSKEPHEYTYQFIFFGAEEYGLVGSQYFASQADLSAVRWMLNIDMVGTPLEIDVAGEKSAPPELIKQVTALAKENRIPYHLSRDFIVMTRESPQGGTSDFGSFLEKGIPALGLGISGRPPGYFHRPEDQLERVSAEDMQKVGDYAYQLVKNVNLSTVGPNEWDALYLPFQLGSKIIIIPSLGIRLFIIITFLWTGILIVNYLRNAAKFNFKTISKIFGILGISLLLSIIVNGFSGIGEILWSWLKHVELLNNAYPMIFVLARLGIGLSTLIFLASWIYKLPLVRDSQLYWFTGTIILLFFSLIVALIRIDLAFPLVFWLFWLDIQWFWPNIVFVLIGPYFIYWLHYELINSQQWMAFYQALYKYPLIFLSIYSVLLTPLLIELLHIGITKTQLNKKRLLYLRKPALCIIVLCILLLGLVPAYTPDFPQSVTVQEEWSGSSQEIMHIFSEEILPKKLVRDLNVQTGKSISFPGLNEKSPLNVDVSIEEKVDKSSRLLNLDFNLKYTDEPYLICFRFESISPFELQTDEFLPMTKLPKKLQLNGVKQPSGIYSLTMQRTPPQRKNIHFSVLTESSLKCTLDGIFGDTSPRIQIQSNDLSIDYQVKYQENFFF
jgi:hypothetical protein